MNISTWYFYKKYYFQSYTISFYGLIGRFRGHTAAGQWGIWPEIKKKINSKCLIASEIVLIKNIWKINPINFSLIFWSIVGRKYICALRSIDLYKNLGKFRIFYIGLVLVGHQNLRIYLRFARNNNRTVGLSFGSSWKKN